MDGIRREGCTLLTVRAATEKLCDNGEGGMFFRNEPGALEL